LRNKAKIFTLTTQANPAWAGLRLQELGLRHSLFDKGGAGGIFYEVGSNCLDLLARRFFKIEKSSKGWAISEGFIMDDQQFRRILDFLGLSWNGYRKVRKGVKKRISRHMLQRRFRGVDELLLAMEREGELRKQMEDLMAVSISRFFRDRGLWQALENQVLPTLLKRRDPAIRAWSAGCACGEEAYSFRILWDTKQRHFEWRPELELWATDMNPLFLDRARAGVYPASSLKELPPEIRSQYFRPIKENRFAVTDSLKEGILWQVHDFRSDDPPQRELQIIFLRNGLLTYYKEELRDPAFGKITASLAAEGFLLIGSHEKLPAACQGLLPFGHHPSIFQKTTLLSLQPPGKREGEECSSA
jgi:chemotaxis protein methyltransferase CheR